MKIHMTEADFERLCGTSMHWGPDWAAHDGRFENYADGAGFQQPPGYQWRYAYWVGEQAASYILAASFLADRGEAYELLWDLDSEEWLILTDYAYPAWRRDVS